MSVREDTERRTTMLIVDMPMPKDGVCHIFVDWDGHSFVCPIKRKACDYFFSKKRPDWCPIHGELVRCGECKNHSAYRCPNDMMLWTHMCNLGHGTLGDEWFCADGERKEKTDAVD